MPALDRNGGAPGAMPMSDDLPRTLRREREARERSGMAGLPHAAPAPIASGYVPEPTMPDGIVVSGMMTFFPWLVKLQILIRVP